MIVVKVIGNIMLVLLVCFAFGGRCCGRGRDGRGEEGGQVGEGAGREDRSPRPVPKAAADCEATE